jgi:hypothetical protein
LWRLIRRERSVTSVSARKITSATSENVKRQARKLNANGPSNMIETPASEMRGMTTEPSD